MATFVVIRHHENRRPVTFIQVPQGLPTYKVVESYQRSLRNAGYAPGVTWKRVDGSAIDALIQAGRMSSG